QHSQLENDNHAYNIFINHTLDSLTEIEWQSKLKYNATIQDKTEHNAFLTSDDLLTRSTDIADNASGKTSDWYHSIKIIRSFKNRDRKFIANYNIGTINTDVNGF